MPKLNVPRELHDRIAEFKRLVEEMIGEKIEMENCAQFILMRGMDLLLTEFLSMVGTESPETLLVTIQKLAARHPAEVYGFIAEAMKLGGDERRREELRNQIGFHALMKKDDDEDE